MNNTRLKETIRYSFKKRRQAKLDIIKLLKEKAGIKVPSKEKALQYLKKNIKSEKDINDVYRSIPKILNFIKKSYVTADKKYYPSDMLKNILVLVALVSIGQGTFPTNAQDANDLLSEEKIITFGYEPLGRLSKKELDKIIDEGDSFRTIKIKILKELKNRNSSLGYVGEDLPDKVNEIGLSGEKHGEFIYSPHKLKNIKDLVFIYKNKN